MELINRFDVELTVSTFNAGDVLEWAPFKVYVAPPNSRIYVQAHDNGRCKIRLQWSNYGARELGIHSESEVLVLVPPRARPKPDLPEDLLPQSDEIGRFLRENWELVRMFYLNLPGRHNWQGAPQSPV